MSEESVSLIITYALRVGGVVLLLFVASRVARFAARLMEQSMRRGKLDESLTRFVGKLTRWVILIMAVVMCLGAFGVETTSFAALLGAAGLAIGLAFQGTLSNFAAGVMLLVFRPFKVGDLIDVGGKLGFVEAVDIFFTTLDTPDNRRVIMPNSQVFGHPIINATWHEKRRADVIVGTAYREDLDAVRAVLEAAASSVEGRLEETPVQVVLTGFGASSIDWEVRVWAPTPDYLAVLQATRRAVKMGLDAAGIGIPFPQMDVHLDGHGGGQSRAGRDV